MTDTAKPMTRDEAEKAARAGAKVGNEAWGPDEWFTGYGDVTIDNWGIKRPWSWVAGSNGWSIVEPAPFTAKAETDTPDAYDRVKWAEGLIRQLPENHDGRNSWLLNFGEGPDVEAMRDKHPLYRAMEKAALTTARKPTPLDDVPGETDDSVTPEGMALVRERAAESIKPGAYRSVCDSERVVTVPEPWRPTIGRDAVTRDGRRARNVRAHDSELYPLAADIDGIEGQPPYTALFTVFGRYDRFSAALHLDLTDDWTEPEQAETPKLCPHPEGSRRWAKWHMKRGRKVRRTTWPQNAWAEWGGNGMIATSVGVSLVRWRIFRDFPDQWQLAEEPK